MSRYVLLPGKLQNSFVLVSTENLNQTHTVELPEHLYDMNIFNNVAIRNTANNLLYRICKSEISKTMDGFVKDGNSKIDMKYDDVIINCCNNVFKECFEEFYRMLQKYNIMF